MKTAPPAKTKFNPERIEQALFASIAFSAWIAILSLLAALVTSTAHLKDRYALIGFASGSFGAVLCVCNALLTPKSE